MLKKFLRRLTPLAIVAAAVVPSAALASGLQTGCVGVIPPQQSSDPSVYCWTLPDQGYDLLAINLRGLHTYSNYKWSVNLYDRFGAYIGTYGPWVRHGTPAYGSNWGPSFTTPQGTRYVQFWVHNDSGQNDNYQMDW